MKKMFVLLVIFIVFISSLYAMTLPKKNNSLKADENYQWIPINNGLYGGIVLTINFDPVNSDILYIGAVDVGIYKSIDKGESWVDISGKIYGVGVNTIAIDYLNPQVIYAGTLSKGIYKTEDGGFSWYEINSGLTSTSVTCIIIDPKNPKVLYAGTSEGVFKSSDSGLSWSSINNGLNDSYIYSLAIDSLNNQILYAGTSEDGIFKSLNAGNSWKPINTGLTNLNVRTIEISKADNRIIYIGTKSGIFKSFDSGSNWTQLGLQNKIVNDTALEPSKSTTIFAATSEGIFKSFDEGKNWVEINEGLEDTTCLSIAIDPKSSQTVFCGTWGGIFKSEHSGNNWINKNKGLTAISVLDIACSPYFPRTIYVGARYSRVFLSKNGGESWDLLKSSPYGVKKVYFSPKNPDTIFLLTDLQVYKSTNGGKSWTFCLNDLYWQLTAQYTTLSIDCDNPDILYLGSYGKGIFKSINGGSNWFPSSNGLTNTYINTISVNPKNSKVIYSGTDEGLFKSIDGGLNWTKIGFSDMLVCSLYIDNIDPATIYATSQYLYRSSNEGKDWEKLTPDLGYICDFVVDPINREKIYLVSKGKVYISNDSGSYWKEISEGIENTLLTCIAIDPFGSNFIYAGTYNSLFKYVLSYSITTSTNFGGSIYPSGSTKVPSGDSKTFTISPNAGYKIKDVKVDGVSVGAVSTYTFTNITSNHTIEVVFEPISCIINVFAGVGGLISPSGTVSVNSGDSKTFTIAPSSGYKIKDVKVDGISVGAVSTYTFTNITSKHTIEVVFEKGISEVIIILHIGDTIFFVNNEVRYLDSPPIIKNGRTILPIRAIVEALGGTVTWNQKEKSVDIILDNNHLILQIGNPNAYVNGMQKFIDPSNLKVVPEIVNGRTMLPLRFVAENLGCNVQWDDVTKTVTIVYIG